jgi:hypothetical protein
MRRVAGTLHQDASDEDDEARHGKLPSLAISCIAAPRLRLLLLSYFPAAMVLGRARTRSPGNSSPALGLVAGAAQMPPHLRLILLVEQVFLYFACTSWSPSSFSTTLTSAATSWNPA